MSAGPVMSFQNEENCQYYASFMAHLDGHHFAAMYWSLFFLVIFMLFTTAAVFQWAMARREEHENGNLDDKYFRRRWFTAMIIALAIFLVTAVFCIMEVFTLMALQFCQGEPLISLYWSSWMMLQLGSEVAILGIVLAMWLHLRGIDHPKWALALGTPVLVVAGFGHVFTHLAEKRIKKLSKKRSERRLSRCTTLSRSATLRGTAIKEGGYTSSAPSIRREGPSNNNDEPVPATFSLSPSPAASSPIMSPMRLEAGRQARAAAPALASVAYFTLDTGDDERVQTWPAYMGLSEDGKAVLRLTPIPGFIPIPAPTAGRVSPGKD